MMTEHSQKDVPLASRKQERNTWLLAWDSLAKGKSKGKKWGLKANLRGD